MLYHMVLTAPIPAGGSTAHIVSSREEGKDDIHIQMNINVLQYNFFLAAAIKWFSMS